MSIELAGTERTVYLPPYADLELPALSGVRLRLRPDINTVAKVPWLISQTWRDRLDVYFSFGHLCPRGCRGRRVFTIYDTAFDSFPECYPPGTAVRAHQEVREACASAACIVVPSAATRDDLLANYSVPSEKVHVILAGTRLHPLSCPPDPLPERLRVAGVAEPFFLCVGRIDPRKNLARAIDAYRALVYDGLRGVSLVIVGPDDIGSGSLREHIARGRVPGERIVITGYVDESELHALYRHCVCLIYPSLAEGFGLPVVEAMAAGAPTITSNVSSMPEAAGGAALLVDPLDVRDIAEAMLRVFRERGLREQLRSAGLSRAGELSWRATAERLIPVLLGAARR